MSYKSIKIILQALLLSVAAIIPFIKITALYFPFISGKIYGFRILVCLAFFFWIWMIIKEYGERAIGSARWHLSLRNILVAGLLLFFLAQIVTSFFGASPVVSFFSSIERQDGVIQYGFWILYFLMLFSAFKSISEWKVFFSVFITSAFLVTSFNWLKLGEGERLAGVFGNPSYLAGYLIFVIGFCFIAVERKFFKNHFINIILLAGSVFFALALLYTQTRGAYLGLVGGVFLFCLLSILFLRSRNKKLALACAIILGVGIISIAGLFLAKDTGFVKERPMLVRMTEVTRFWEIGSIRERILNWQIALKSFSEKPIFGYGPENFPVAFNKHYDYRIGRGDPWFDRTHNIFLEPMATGGIALFSAYLFFLVSVGYIIFRISRKEKMLSFILASIFLGYLIQGVFLFDALPIYLGLFPFLAFIAYAYAERKTEKAQDFGNQKRKDTPRPFIDRFHKPIIVVTALACVFGIYTTVFVPYKTSAAAIQFLAYTSQGYYKEGKPFAEKSFAGNSPYVYWEIRKRVGWQLLAILDQEKELTADEAKEVGELYDFIVPELEKFVEARPSDSQIYYILPRVYRLGTEKLGKNDLPKAQALLQQSFSYSDLRLEYYNEMARVFLSQDKFDEGKMLLEDYAKRVQSYPYFPYLLMGHYYFVAEKYDLAMENYKAAKAQGYDFTEIEGEYSRYVATAEKIKDYRAIVDISEDRLKNYGPNADIYFNIALGYFYLEETEMARDFFLKAVDLDKDQYQKYEHFFQ